MSLERETGKLKYSTQNPRCAQASCKTELESRKPSSAHCLHYENNFENKNSLPLERVRTEILSMVSGFMKAEGRAGRQENSSHH